MGAERAVATAAALNSQGADALLSWGCSAALDPALDAGQLLLPETFIGEDGSSHYPDHTWWTRLRKALSQPLEPLTQSVTGTSTLLAKPTDKARLFGKTGACAADMESPWLACWARQRGIPFAAVRAVSDRADATLPAAIGIASGPVGDIDIIRMLAHLVVHPGEIPALITLGRQFARARSRLAEAAAVLQQKDFGLSC